MPRSGDITFERLADWLEGRLSDEDARKVEEALASADKATKEDADWLRDFLKVSSETKLASPPPEVRERISRHLRRFTEGPPEPGFFKRLVANLTFDSDAGLAVAGLRSAGGAGGTQRQLVYSADDVDLALDVRRRPGGTLDVGGQILPSKAEPAEFSVQLLRGGLEFCIARADEMGEFFCRNLPPGTYEIILSTGEFDVTVGPLVLEA